MWTIGFVTGDPAPEISSQFDQKFLSVYVPTTPNPTSGYLIFVPTSEATILDMSVEEGLKYVISTGIVHPESGANATAGNAPLPLK